MARTLVITTGDASDADGFLSLAMYAQMGVDVTYIMTLPACYNPALGSTESPGSGAPQDANAPGLGYSYRRENPEELVELCKKIVWTIWNAENGARDNELKFLCRDDKSLFYNEINGFDDAHLMHETSVYGDLDLRGDFKDDFEKSATYALDTSGYDRVYMDMNGSVPFMNGTTYALMSEVIGNPNFQGLYVMGGVDTINSKPFTLILPFLNRFPLSTMNQYYAPKATALLLDLVEENAKELFFVTNDEVNKNGSFPTADAMAKVYAKFETPTINIAETYYAYKLKVTGNTGAQKMFDLMTSAAIMHREMPIQMEESGLRHSVARSEVMPAFYDAMGGALPSAKVILFNNLASDATPYDWDHWKPVDAVPAGYFFDPVYGTTIVVRGDNTDEDLANYLEIQIGTATVKRDSETLASWTEERTQAAIVAKRPAYNQWVETMSAAYVEYLESLVPAKDQEGGGRQHNAVAMASLALTTFAMAVIGSMR